ncbi:Flagellar basal-body rod protein FlgG [Petrocella atlantisensis]|uniref:Flagellar basal-body rod protein FlgG n=1 Tax=Petrocella atlantisensis TaxID=2173034 RepID=A0A3P7PZF5_9FIRM|nr:flagellar hook-basal body protein [Petrocella atlantisensis]MCF8020650.1 flagellar hook-basal body protein [Vallitaleaceae bacterium]VDN48521.1 Flagellar basal-body rod protein FlgG [Petrocella atlantisensis]
MMRSLWTAASGMKTQQATVDSIANNLSNVNTVGFKKERLEFKSLLYETMKNAGDIANGGSPVNLQVGHGVRTVASVKSFTQGTFERTEGPLDFAIEGDGFFALMDVNGNPIYTRDGSFKTSILDGELMLTSSTGRPVLGIDGEPIVFDETVVADKLSVDEQGIFSTIVDGDRVDLGLQLQVVQFQNSQGLKTIGGGFYEQTVASGIPIIEVDNEETEGSMVVQGALEASNVQAVEEMVKLIVAQRAYELSSKAIQSSDEMLQRANELKR